MNIALYGGSFDPPHLGHLHVVTAALDTLDIDKLIIVPAFVNPFKTGTHAPAKLRFKWLNAIFKANKQVEITDFEVIQNRAVTSIETVKHFNAIYKKIYFIIGADNLASLEKWHHFDELDRLVTWVVATRDKIQIDEKYIQLAVEHPISSSELREELNEEHLPKEVATEIKTYYEENHARSH
jgi:nicotinate-nucleotide adenylyltransferase